MKIAGLACVQRGRRDVCIQAIEGCEKRVYFPEERNAFVP